MGFLKDLTVSKISFVTKAANKRKFVLLKSEDAKIDNGEYLPMRKELKDALSSVIKSKSTVNLAKTEDIIAVLKSDTVLKMTDAEVAEITDYMDVIKQSTIEDPIIETKPVVDSTIIQKQEDNKKEEEKMEKAEKDALLDRLQKAETALADVTKSNKRSGIVTWLQKECPFLPDDLQKTADTIMELDAVSPAAAESFKSTLQKSSVAVQNSKMFEEKGRTSTESILKSDGDSNGFDLVRKVSDALTTLKKSDKPMNASNLTSIIQGFGNEFETYRKSHILRARTQAI
jgi:hypothetical protein